MLILLKTTSPLDIFQMGTKKGLHFGKVLNHILDAKIKSLNFGNNPIDRGGF